MAHGTSRQWAILAAFVVTGLTPGLAAASEYRWKVTGSGNWNVAANWELLAGVAGLGYPNLAGDIATFGGQLSATQSMTITIPDGVTIRIATLTIGELGTVIIDAAGTGLLELNGAQANTFVTINGTKTHGIGAPIRLARNVIFTVTDPSGTLVLGGAGASISETGGARTVTKAGPGILQFAYSTSNSYTGTTFVADGLLSLQHGGTAEMITHALTVGDGTGTAGSAEVRLGNNDNISDTVPVTVGGFDGMFNLANRTERIGTLNVVRGTAWLGAGSTGVLTMGTVGCTGGTLLTGVAGSSFVMTADVQNATSFSTVPCLVDGGGSLSLGGTGRQITVDDGPGAVDMDIRTAIIGTAGEGLTKLGLGVLRFGGTGTNLYTGQTRVLAGRLELAHTAGVAIGTGGADVIGVVGGNPTETRLLNVDNIADTADVAVRTGAVFDLNGQRETIDDLFILEGIVRTGAGGSVAPVLKVDNLTMTGGAVDTGTATGLALEVGNQTTATSTAQQVVTIAGVGGVRMIGAPHTVSVIDGPQAIDLRVDAPIVATTTSGLRMVGPGTARFTGNNTYTGPTLVSGGVLWVNGTHPESAVVVTEGVLGGIGTVKSLSMNSGLLAPGTSPGTLHTGNVTAASAAVFVWDIHGTAPGSGYDQLDVNGTVSLGQAQFGINVADAFTPSPLASFTIIDNDGTDPVTGTFSGMPEGGTISFGSPARVTFRITYHGGDGNDVVLSDVTPISYFLAEGATGSFFDEDVLIANPNTTAAPVTLTFLLEGGNTIVEDRTVAAQSRLTVRVDDVPGLASTAASVQVTSEDGLPLVVERTMFWDATYYGGHTSNAVSKAETTWTFAEGFQGFFDTYVLIANANATATNVRLTFLREGEAPVLKVLTVDGFARKTIYAGDYPELVGRAFGTVVQSSFPVTAERAMYFGSIPGKFWSGGHVNTGIVTPSTSWFHAEGATGGFFNTFILLSNPQDVAAHVDLQFLLESGQVVTRTKTLAARARLTVNPAAEGDARLTAAAFSTVVTSDVGIVSERSMYWPGDATPFGEGHNSSGVVSTATRWGLAEGRVGGNLGFLTFILLANPQSTAANVTITYLRESGAPVVKTYTVPATSRFNVDVGSVVPELRNESFGARIEVTNGVEIAVERSVYWNANGIFFAGGTNALGTPLP